MSQATKANGIDRMPCGYLYCEEQRRSRGGGGAEVEEDRRSRRWSCDRQMLTTPIVKLHR